MLISEEKRGDKYLYKVEEIFGSIEMENQYKLDADTLDGCISLIMNQPSNSGAIKHTPRDIKFSFKRKSQWEDEEKDDDKLADVVKLKKIGLVGRIKKWLIKKLQ